MHTGEQDVLEQRSIDLLPTAHQGTARILAVGSPKEWERSSACGRGSGNLLFVAFAEVDAELLRQTTPDAIISPALGWDFDCIDLAVRLTKLGYKGLYRATALNLPRPEVVECEIRQLCPNLDFGIITSY